MSLTEAPPALVTVGASPAVINAVVDPPSHLGVRNLAMPASPPRVWDAIQASKGETS